MLGRAVVLVTLVASIAPPTVAAWTCTPDPTGICHGQYHVLEAVEETVERTEDDARRSAEDPCDARCEATPSMDAPPAPPASVIPSTKTPRPAPPAFSPPALPAPEPPPFPDAVPASAPELGDLAAPSIPLRSASPPDLAFPDLDVPRFVRGSGAPDPAGAYERGTPAARPPGAWNGDGPAPPSPGRGEGGPVPGSAPLGVARRDAGGAAPQAPAGPWTSLSAIGGLLAAPALLALYRRLVSTRALENPTRRAIHDHVLAHPGITCADVARAVGVQYVTAKRHLRVLAEFGYLASFSASPETRWFEDHGRFSPETKRDLALLSRPHNAAFLQAVARFPEAGVSELARRTGLSKSTVSRRASRLCAAGLLRPEGPGFAPVPRAVQTPTPQAAKGRAEGVAPR